MRSTIGEINLRIVPIFSDILICSLDPPVLKPIKFISRTTSITGIYITKCPTTVISKNRQWQLVAKLKMFFVMFVGKISCLVDVSDLLADLGWYPDFTFRIFWIFGFLLPPSSHPSSSASHVVLFLPFSALPHNLASSSSSSPQGPRVVDIFIITATLVPIHHQ